MLEVPFTSDYDQRFITQLGDDKYLIDARWNERGQAWTFDLTRDSDQVQVLAGAPLLIGQDVLAPYALGIGGLLVTDLGKLDTDAGPEDLGTRVIVTYVTPDELAGIKAALGPQGASIVASGAPPALVRGNSGAGAGAGGGTGSVVINQTVNNTSNTFNVTGGQGFGKTLELDDATGDETMIARFPIMFGLNPNPTVSINVAALARGDGTLRVYVGGIAETIGSTGAPSGSSVGTPASISGDDIYEVSGSVANPGVTAMVKITMESAAPATSVGVSEVQGSVG
jgi:hypothetical protein